MDEVPSAKISLFVNVMEGYSIECDLCLYTVRTSIASND